MLKVIQVDLHIFSRNWVFIKKSFYYPSIHTASEIIKLSHCLMCSLCWHMWNCFLVALLLASIWGYTVSIADFYPVCEIWFGKCTRTKLVKIRDAYDLVAFHLISLLCDNHLMMLVWSKYVVKLTIFTEKCFMTAANIDRQMLWAIPNKNHFHNRILHNKCICTLTTQKNCVGNEHRSFLSTFTHTLFSMTISIYIRLSERCTLLP
jgi:hypothetical protein